jgi:hypothetical protein
LFAADKRTGEADEEASGDSRVRGYRVRHHWTLDLPLSARAMVLADETLFVAGPVDLLDEESAMRQINEPQVQQQLARQAAAFEGEEGSLLWAVSAADGRKLAEMPLEETPVFDGLAAAGGRLYMTTQQGAVVCLAGP